MALTPVAQQIVDEAIERKLYVLITETGVVMIKRSWSAKYIELAFAGSDERSSQGALRGWHRRQR